MVTNSKVCDNVIKGIIVLVYRKQLIITIEGLHFVLF